MTTVVCTSDLHGELPDDLPEGDVLVIGGDVCPLWDHDRQFQANWLKSTFRHWLIGQPHDEIIFVGGNHDFVLQSTPRNVVKEWFDSIHYLQDEELVLDGVRFYGTPWSPTFGNWAFMADEDELGPIYSLIPNAVDVLISHGPPRGLCDLTARWDNEHVGSTSLLDRIEEVAPRYVICGHIHEAYGSDHIGDTRVLNVSLMDVDYNPVNVSVVVEL